MLLLIMSDQMLPPLVFLDQLMLLLEVLDQLLPLLVLLDQLMLLLEVFKCPWLGRL